MSCLRLGALVALLAACKSSSSAPPPSPSTTATPVVVAVDAAPAVVAAVDAALAGPNLPGTLYFKVGDALAALHDGVLVTDFADVGAPVFPSQVALPDGRVVGIASEGTGAAGAEQLVLIGPGAKVERIGPAITQVRHPAVDPKGAWIVIEAKLEPHSELYRIDLAKPAAPPLRLTKNPQGNFTPAVLDGKTIVFASSRDGDSEIYRLDLATKKAKRLTAFHKDDWSPRPSPDGKTIAFLSDRTGSPLIYLVDATGTNLRRLTGSDSGEEDEPVWSPDGKSIAFLRSSAGTRERAHRNEVAIGAGGTRLVVVGVSSAMERAAGLAVTERVLTPHDASDIEPAWSPDSQWIAVARHAGDTEDIVAIPLAPGAAPVTVSRAAAGASRLPRWHAR